MVLITNSRTFSHLKIIHDSNYTYLSKGFQLRCLQPRAQTPSMCTDEEGLETRLRCPGMAKQGTGLEFVEIFWKFHLASGASGNRFASSHGMQLELYSEIL